MIELPFIDRIPEIERDQFQTRLLQICEELEIDPVHLMLVMFFESKLDPQKKNPHSSAVGLIQFMRKTASSLGTTRDALLRMNAVQQLEYVKMYFAPFKGRLRTFIDVYFAVFYPAAIGKPDDWTFPFPPHVVRANHWFDLNGNGQIQVWEVKERLRMFFEKHGFKG